MKNFQPNSQQQNERMIAKDHRSFGAGAFDDISPSKIPPNGVKWLKNYVAFDDRLEPRGGSKRWSTSQIPKLLSGLTLTKSGATVTATGQLAGIYAGCVVHYDDGGYDIVIDVSGSPNTCIVDSTTVHAASTAAWVAEPIFGWGYHKQKGVLLLHIGDKLYVANHNLASGGTYSLSAGWNRIQILACGGYAIGKNYSDIKERGDTLVIFNDPETANLYTGGIFVLNLNHAPIECFRMNSPVPTVVPTHSYGTVKTDTNKYGYRYLYTMSKQYNPSSATLLNKRTTTSQILELESGPTQPDASTNKDYAEMWDDDRVGPGLSAEYYDKWNNVAMPADYDTIAEFAAIANGQFKATINAVAYNITCVFTGVTSWEEVAEAVQTGLRDHFPTAVCEYVTDHLEFWVPIKGTTITAIAAGTSNDISACFSTSGASQDVVWDATKTLAALTCPTNGALNKAYDLWTHYSIYRTMDIGENGIDPITGQGNNKERYVWVNDVTLVKTFKCTISSGLDKRVTATSSVFEASDVGSSIVFSNGVTKVIASYTSATEVDVTSLSGLDDDDVLSGTIGAQYTCLATKSGTTITVGPTGTGTAIITAIDGTGIGTVVPTIDYSFSSLNVGDTISIDYGNGYNDYTILSKLANSITIQTPLLSADAPKNCIYNFGSQTLSGPSVGQRIFWEDGSYDIITAVSNDDKTFTVETSGTKTIQGMAVNPTSRKFVDNVADTTLETRISAFSLLNRFWEALPNLNTGIISNGFLLGAVRNTNQIDYCQMADGYEYLAGYHNAAKQIALFKDPITRVILENDNAMVLCRGSMHRIPLNNYIEDKIESIGEVVVVLAGSAVVSPDIGMSDFGAMKMLTAYSAIIITSDNELRVLEYTSAPQLSDDLAKDRFRKRLRKNVGRATISYDKINGILIWVKATSWVTRSYSATGLIAELPDASYRFALNKEQGNGVSENTGSAWVIPPSGVPGLTVFDTSLQARHLVLDVTDGYIYDLTSREAATGSGISRLFRDKILTDGTGGTRIASEVLFPLDEGERKRFFVQHKNSHVFMEPFDRDKANDSGYTSEGYPDDLDADLTLYQDGDASTVKARAKDVDFTGDVVYDRSVRAHGLQLKFNTNTAEHIVVGRLQEYEVEDKADVPDKDYTTEMDHQEDLGNTDFHLFPLNGSIINRVTGKVPTTTAGTLTTGPDGGTTAIQLSTGTIEDTNKTLSLTGDFALKVGFSSINATGTYFYIGTAFWVRCYIDGSTYKVDVRYNGTTYTTSLTWDGSDWVEITVSRSGTTISVFEGQ